MSLLICPLCWKANSLANYDPSDLPLDVVVRTVEGLGRGRGFRTVSEESALDEPELLSEMAERLVQLVGLFYANDLISRKGVIAKIGGESKGATEDYAEVSRTKSETWRTRSGRSLMSKRQIPTLSRLSG